MRRGDIVDTGDHTSAELSLREGGGAGVSRRATGEGPSALTLAVTTDDEERHRAIITATGDLDFASHHRLQEALSAELDRGHSELVLDVGGVPFCDSSALGVLIQVHHQARFRGGWLRLVRPAAQLQRSLVVTNLDRLLASYETVEAAVADDST
jgi:anti-sigma B factor antagonist